MSSSGRRFARSLLRPANLPRVALAAATGVVLLAAGIAGAAHLLRHARADALARDLHTFSEAFKACALQRGDWPEGDGVPGALPPAAAEQLHAANWSRRTPIGGRYTWDPGSLHRDVRYRAVIVVASTPNNPVTTGLRQLRIVDRRIDDGDLATGDFFLGHRNEPVFVLER